MPKPTIIFAMRYPDDVGYVWKTIARVRDEIASHLVIDYNCVLAHPGLSSEPVYAPKFLQKVALDCYSAAPNARGVLRRFAESNAVCAIVYMSADPAEIAVHEIHRWGVKTISTENNSFDEKRKDSLPLAATKYFVRSILRWRLHHHYIPNSNSKRDWLLNYAKLPSNRVTAVPNGVDVQITQPERAAYPAKRGRWVVAVGQARAVKRIDLFISAAYALSRESRFQDVDFLYIGDGEMLAKWISLVEELGLSDRFHFLGAQPDPYPWLYFADVFVHCAELESFGLAVAEAMLAGLPVVAYRATGPAEIVVSGVTGELVSALAAAPFAAAISRYLDDRELSESHGSAGRQRVLSKFSLERQGEDIARIVRHVLVASPNY